MSDNRQSLSDLASLTGAAAPAPAPAETPAAEGINLADMHGSRSFRSRGEVFQRGKIGHYQALLTFLLFSDATSRATGCCASWGWFEPA